MVKAYKDTEEFVPNCNNNHHFRQSLQKRKFETLGVLALR